MSERGGILFVSEALREFDVQLYSGLLDAAPDTNDRTDMGLHATGDWQCRNLGRFLRSTFPSAEYAFCFYSGSPSGAETIRMALPDSVGLPIPHLASEDTTDPTRALSGDQITQKILDIETVAPMLGALAQSKTIIAVVPRPTLLAARLAPSLGNMDSRGHFTNGRAVSTIKNCQVDHYTIGSDGRAETFTTIRAAKKHPVSSKKIHINRG